MWSNDNSPSALESWEDLAQGPKPKEPEGPSLPTRITLSQFTEFAFYVPDRKSQTGYSRFSFEGRRYFRSIYNSSCNRILLCTARQVEKSTFLGNTAIGVSCLIPAHLTMYVSPSTTQTKTFSFDRIKEPLEVSPILKQWAAKSPIDNVFERQFANRSKITLRSAFLNANRTRGIPTHKLLLDEFQDLLVDNIPIIEQCTAHADKELRSFLYAGTPKSFDNPIEYYKTELSTQGEWVVPCDTCGSKAGSGRFWNILGESNIGKKHLICSKCGTQIFPNHEEAQWAFARKRDGKKVTFEGYRISQLMVPWKPWEEIIIDYEKYSREAFYNEVLGLSFESGSRPLTKRHLQDCCNPNLTMHPVSLENFRKIAIQQKEVFAGIDWGTGENTYTVLSLGTYSDNKFSIFYIHRFEGADTDPEVQVEKIASICHAFNTQIIGADYGGGFDRNYKLVTKFGASRVHKFQYAANSKSKMVWNKELNRWIILRTEIMSDLFNAIKRQKLEFPRWEEFESPFGADMLSIYGEYNQTLRKVLYNHKPSSTDDSFHSVLYCFLASSLRVPRPDVFAPNFEDTEGNPVMYYPEPSNQW